MSILFTLKGELDRRLYWIQMRQEALRFISGYRRNNIIDISFLEVYEFQLFFFSEAEFNSFSKEIVLVMRNCCITMSEIGL